MKKIQNLLQIELDDVGVEESDEVAAETESLATTSQIRFTDEQFEAVGGNKIKLQYSAIGGIKEHCWSYWEMGHLFISFLLGTNLNYVTYQKLQMCMEAAKKTENLLTTS